MDENWIIIINIIIIIIIIIIDMNVSCNRSFLSGTVIPQLTSDPANEFFG